MFTDVLSWPICFMFDNREFLYTTFIFRWQQRRRLKNLATTYPLVSVYEYGVDYIYIVLVFKGLICVAGQYLFWWSVRLFAVC